jgi:uncharacterized membrane protein
MIIYHFSFDLDYFGFASFDFSGNNFWRYFRFSIVSSFLLIVGYSLYLTHAQAIRFDKVYKRTLTLGFYSLLITTVTYFVFPHSFIYFGILHFIAVASILGLLFIKIPIVALFVGFMILGGHLMGCIHMHGLFDLLKEPLHLPNRSEDLVPLTPWMAPVLIGIFLGHLRIIPATKPQPFTRAINFLGRHALVVYMLHQVILFALFYLAYFVLN